MTHLGSVHTDADTHLKSPNIYFNVPSSCLQLGAHGIYILAHFGLYVIFTEYTNISYVNENRLVIRRQAWSRRRFRANLSRDAQNERIFGQPTQRKGQQKTHTFQMARENKNKNHCSLQLMQLTPPDIVNLALTYHSI